MFRSLRRTHPVLKCIVDLVRRICQHLTWRRTPYSADRVAVAIADGAKIISGALALGERDADLSCLITSAIHTALTNPTATFDDVIDDHYFDPPEVIKSWWANWT